MKSKEDLNKNKIKEQIYKILETENRPLNITEIKEILNKNEGIKKSPQFIKKNVKYLVNDKRIIEQKEEKRNRYRIIKLRVRHKVAIKTN